MRIPFLILPWKIIDKLSIPFRGIGELLDSLFPFLKVHLIQSNQVIESKRYLAASFINFFFVLLLLLILNILVFIKLEISLIYSIIAPIIISLLIFLQQIYYPKLLASRRIRGIERNLLNALNSILIQLNAGVPIFNIFATIANEDYGEISKEFRSAVKQINAGKPESDSIEELASRNPSPFFRRAIWQLANGIRTGSDLQLVLKEIISSISDEQIIQIQKYGSQLNPLAMFYMLIAVILPSLGITFLVVLSSFTSLGSFATKIAFWILFALFIILQILFLGIIKTKRPTLLT